MTELKLGAVIGALVLPFLLWTTVRIVMKGELILTDDYGATTDFVKRESRPLKFWAVTAFNCSLIVADIALIYWQFWTL